MPKISFKDFAKNLEAQITSTLKSKSFLKRLGDAAAEAIRSRTRAGYGVSEGGGFEGASQKRLKSLAKSTVKSRIQLAQKGALSSKTTPKFSNLTRTGQLLDSIKTTSVSQNSATVNPSGRRNDGKTNQEVAGYVEDQGRPFNKLTSAEVRKIVNIVESEVVKLVRRLT